MESGRTNKYYHQMTTSWDQVLPALLGGLLLVGAIQGCSVAPGQQDAIRQAWEERDAERMRECQRAGRGFVAGGCGGGGGP